MSNLLIKNEKLAKVIRTDDGIEAFEIAADNGQFRLAIDILNDLLPTIVEKIAELEAKIDSLSVSPQQSKSTTSKQKEDKVDIQTEVK